MNTIFFGCLKVAIMAGLLLAVTAAYADDPTAMAPPVQTSVAPTLGGSAGADSVFNWQEVPANQSVPLTHASFDQGGYQLYDTVGETIVVPFTNQNLYVMKFARSSNSTMYFVNQANTPILYVPRHSYLQNATVSGARWYPFGKNFHPTQPVYLGVAPSWPVFVGMGWYPSMICYGGYWSNTSFVMGGVFGPSYGLYFNIGGSPYYGWGGYQDYVHAHTGYDRIGYSVSGLYRWAGRPRAPLRPFAGANHAIYAHRTFAGASGPGGQNVFRGVMGSGQGVRGFGGRQGVAVPQRFSIGQPVGGRSTFGGGQRGSGQSAFGGGQRGGGGAHGHR